MAKHKDSPFDVSPGTASSPLAEQFCLSIAETAVGQRPITVPVKAEQNIRPATSQLVAKVGNELGKLAEAIVRKQDLAQLDDILTTMQGAFDDMQPEVQEDLRDKKHLLSTQAVDGIANHLKTKLELHEPTARALTRNFGQRLLVELSKPAYLRAAEAEAGRRGQGTTARDVLEEDSRNYRDGIQDAFKSLSLHDD